MYHRQFLEYIRGTVWHFVHPLLWLENRTLGPKKGHNLATLLHLSHYSVQDLDPDIDGSISLWWYFHKIIEDATLCQACLGWYWPQILHSFWSKIQSQEMPDNHPFDPIMVQRTGYISLHSFRVLHIDLSLVASPAFCSHMCCHFRLLVTTAQRRFRSATENQMKKQLYITCKVFKMGTSYVVLWT